MSSSVRPPHGKFRYVLEIWLPSHWESGSSAASNSQQLHSINPGVGKSAIKRAQRNKGRCQTGTTFHARAPAPLTNGNGNRCPLCGNQLVEGKKTGECPWVKLQGILDPLAVAGLWRVAFQRQERV
ncbi:hypothetical protein B0H11DRAFT_2248005 [Mycena galericulata]|nr:hypothetical protein B0H11DRAFT_2248005 [Mycena galericulata]